MRNLVQLIIPSLVVLTMGVEVWYFCHPYALVELGRLFPAHITRCDR